MVLAVMIRVIGWKRDRLIVIGDPGVGHGHADRRMMSSMVGDHLQLFVRLLGVWVSQREQDGIERTINAVNGVVVRVIGR